MEPWVLPVVVTVTGALIAAAASYGNYRTSRNLGLTPGQQALVRNLQATVSAQETRLELVEQEKDECKSELTAVKRSVVALQDANAELGRDLHKLHGQLDAWEKAYPPGGGEYRPPPAPRRRTRQ